MKKHTCKDHWSSLTQNTRQPSDTELGCIRNTLDETFKSQASNYSASKFCCCVNVARTSATKARFSLWSNLALMNFNLSDTSPTVSHTWPFPFDLVQSSIFRFRPSIQAFHTLAKLRVSDLQTPSGGHHEDQQQNGTSVCKIPGCQLGPWPSALESSTSKGEVLPCFGEKKKCYHKWPTVVVVLAEASLLGAPGLSKRLFEASRVHQVIHDMLPWWVSTLRWSPICMWRRGNLGPTENQQAIRNPFWIHGNQLQARTALKSCFPNTHTHLMILVNPLCGSATDPTYHQNKWSIFCKTHSPPAKNALSCSSTPIEPEHFETHIAKWHRS